VLTALVAFAGVSIVVIVTPGPDTALTIRNTLAGGRRSGIATALGVATGQATWTVAASLGLAALIAASEPAFHALKLAGAAYLVFLGLSAVRSALSRHIPAAAEVRRARLEPRRAGLQGLLSNLGNPKMAVFFTSLLPQFASSFTALLALGLLFASMTLAWLSFYAVMVYRAQRWLTRGTVRRALDAVAGTVLVAFGVRLAAEAR
jgi:threonine/homoserine/homoserine lactone efflux protein